MIDRTWLAYVRFRSVDLDIELTALEAALKADGSLAMANWRGQESHAVDVSDLDRVGSAMLSRDPWAFADRRVVVRFDESDLARSPVSDPVAELAIIPANGAKL